LKIRNFISLFLATPYAILVSINRERNVSIVAFRSAKETLLAKEAGHWCKRGMNAGFLSAESEFARHAAFAERKATIARFSANEIVRPFRTASSPSMAGN
jgi:hypothetical protein